MAQRTITRDGEVISGNRRPLVPITGTRGNEIYGDAIKYKYKPISEVPSRCPFAINPVSGVIDLVKAHPNWCKNKTTIISDDLIELNIKFYSPKYSSFLTDLYANISNITEIGGALGRNETTIGGLIVENPYLNTVLCDNTQFQLKLPLLKALVNSHQTQFGSGDDGPRGSGISNILGDLKNFATNNASAKGIGKFSIGKILGAGSVLSNLPAIIGDAGRVFFPSIGKKNDSYYFDSMGLQTWSIEFSLLNTISPEETRYNLSVISILSQLMSSSDRNRQISDSSCICSIDTGTRWLPLNTINFEYTQEGNYLEVEGLGPISEVINCKLDISEQIPATRNLQQAYDQGVNLPAINDDPDAICSQIRRSLGSIGDIVDRISG